MFQWGMIGGSIMIVAIIAGLPWGAVGVAASYSLVSLLVVTPLLFWFVGRHGPVRALDFYRTCAPVVVASLGVLASLLTLRQWTSITRPVAGLVLGFTLTIVSTTFTLCLTRAGRAVLSDLHQMFLLLIGRDKAEPLIKPTVRSSQLAT